jgi:hypothetical protein
VKILVDIGFHAYTSLVAKLDLSQQEHKQLKDMLAIAGGEQKNDELIITVLCELEGAKALLEFANKNCPEAVLDIATSINFSLGQ